VLICFIRVVRVPLSIGIMFKVRLQTLQIIALQFSRGKAFSNFQINLFPN